MIYEGDILRYVDSKLPGHESPSVDYKLCGLLLDCRIDLFQKELKKHYKIDNYLPKHYKEALMILDNVTHVDSVNYSDPAMTSSYQDFLKTIRQNTEDKEVYYELTRRFGDTYWCYYYCTRRK